MDLSLAIAVVFALILFGSHHLLVASGLQEDLLRSLGGGMAISYAFLQLLPELVAESESIGFSVHIWMLAGFLLYCGLERWISRTERTGEVGAEDVVRGRPLHVGLYGGYAFLVLLGTPFGKHREWIHLVVLVAALGLHFAYHNYCLHRRFKDGFHLGWRLPLAIVPFAALAVSQFSSLHETEWREILIAFVIGIVLVNVFREEMPSQERSRFGWFLAGALIFALLVGINEYF